MLRRALSAACVVAVRDADRLTVHVTGAGSSRLPAHQPQGHRDHEEDGEDNKASCHFAVHGEGYAAADSDEEGNQRNHPAGWFRQEGRLVAPLSRYWRAGG